MHEVKFVPQIIENANFDKCGIYVIVHNYVRKFYNGL